MFGTILVTVRAIQHVAARCGQMKETEVHVAEQTMGGQAAIKFPPGQDPNDPAFTRLTEEQMTALRELAAGKPIGEAAASRRG